jgi:hypothetical protein
MNVMNQDNILGGDFNLSLGRANIWDSTTHVDHLFIFLIQKLDERGLLEIMPIKLNPST